MESRSNPLTRRCPRLGGPVAFKYCLSCEAGELCGKVIDCWWETFDVVRYLEDHLTPEQMRRLLEARPKPKITALVELAARARESGKEGT